MASNRFPPPASSDVRLPSIKDLNFYRPSRSSSSWPTPRQQQQQLPRHDIPQPTKRDSEDSQPRTEPVPTYSQYPASYHPHEHQQHQHQQHYPYYAHPPPAPPPPPPSAPATQHQQQSQHQQQQQRPPAPPRPAYQQEPPHSQPYPQSYFPRPPPPAPPPPQPPVHAQPAPTQQQPTNPAPAVYQPHYAHPQQQAPPQYHPPPPQPYGRSSPEEPKPSPSTHHHDSRVTEILNHCTLLCDFARRYASSPHLQPTPEERAAMQRKSDSVLLLLTEMRDVTFPSPSLLSSTPSSSSTLKSDHQFILQDGRRPPKRPWEDMAAAQDSQDARPPSDSPSSAAHDPIKLAERDMEIIRNKRATTAAQANGTTSDANNKTKYRKRSRASPPGKCHSCNIRETPEWRRGPDGARTLCNACGLHYAKLMRKRDKANGGPDSIPTIDSVRASALQELTHGQDHTKDAPSPATSSSSLPVIPHSSSNNTHTNATSPTYDPIPSYHRASPPTTSSTTQSTTYSSPPEPPYNPSSQSFMRHSR